MADEIQVPEAWQLDSGLRESMILSIHAAYFAPHADYQDGKQLMLWLIGTDENEEAAEVRMSIGADWTTDDGNIVTHPTKKQQHINKNSIYGFFLQYAFKIPELTRVLFERAEALGGYGPRDARVWVNLILDLQNRELTWGKGIDPQERLMPVAFLGLVGEVPPAGAPVPAAQMAPVVPLTQPQPVGQPPVPPGVTPPPTVPAPPAGTVPTAPAQVAQSIPAQPAQPQPSPFPPGQSPADLVAAAKAAAGQPAVSNGSPLYAKALSLAQAAPDFSTFLNQALGDAEILQDEELSIQCADQNMIWTAAHPV